MISGERMTDVSAAPYCAAGDGKTNDRAAIQKAIDDVYSDGGGTVYLTEGKTFLSAGIVLRSNVCLRFGEGSVLLQSPRREDYVKPSGDTLIPYLPSYGHNFSEEIKWSHYWYWNYPLIFAPEGSHDFCVCGNGTVRMMIVDDPEKIIKICPIGFYRCHHFEIRDVHITNYHSYAVMPFSCDHGLISDLKITDWSYGNGDGVCMMNCRHMRVTGCDMYTGDDSVYIFSSYRDPRKSEWWSSDEPQPSEDIEIDHNRLRSNHCKAFGMILWGLNCPDLEKVEVRDVYVHDNYFETMGNWLYNPYTDKAGCPPVTHVRFENNVIDGIEINFFETQISDMNHYHSMRRFQNGNFAHGRSFWSMRKNTSPDSVGVFRDPQSRDGASYGYIKDLEAGDAALYEGVYIESGKRTLFRAEVLSSGDPCRVFVRSLDSGDLIASEAFENTDWEEICLLFSVPESGNYHVGIERGTAEKGFAKIRNAVLGNHEDAFGFDDVIYDRGKIIYKYSGNQKTEPV